MKTVATLVCAAAVLSLCASAWPAILYVPSQYSTIQGAINACSVGDTVMVAPGTYTGSGNRDLDFGGKDICVMSSNGPWVTVIDSQGSSSNPHRGFIFQNSETPSATVQGFTIQNGWAGDGGAVSCQNSSPTITGNVIQGNTAQYIGGGISFLGGSSPVITGNFILANGANAGGGIYGQDPSTPTVSGNLIEANAAAQDGSGIAFGPLCGGTISGNTIRGNAGGGMGGGIACYASFPSIVGNKIDLNSGPMGGGGIACWYFSSPTIDSNTIVGNVAGSNPGGGIWCWQWSSPTMDRNTFSGNFAGNGGAIGCDMGCTPTVRNSILWANVSTTNPEIYVGPNSSTITVDYTDVQGGWPGTGNINADPKFLLPPQLDFRLLWPSPCIDAGDPTPSLNDPDGTRRDMGAHYFDQGPTLTLYLTPSSSHVTPGGQLRVRYTVINRNAGPVTFSVVSNVVLPNGNTLNVLGPSSYTIPGNVTVQRTLTHNAPAAAPVGHYQYQSSITGILSPPPMQVFGFLVP